MGREAGMTIAAAAKGMGKTYYTMHFIAQYVKDKIFNKVRGRKALIMDTNGEYTAQQLTKNNVSGLVIGNLAVQDVIRFASPNHPVEARRIDMKSLSIKEKLDVTKYCLQNFTNGLIVLEDINNYVLNITHMEEIVGTIIAARHRGLDIIINYQSLRPIEPRIWQNANWIRMHHQLDNVADIKGKVPNPEILKIAQLIVNNRYATGDQRFYLFINQYESKIDGTFTEQEYEAACKQYLSINKRELKEYMNMNGVGIEQAYQGAVVNLKKKYLSQPAQPTQTV